jgi:hypothetical protein
MATASPTTCKGQYAIKTLVSFTIIVGTLYIDTIRPKKLHDLNVNFLKLSMLCEKKEK